MENLSHRPRPRSPVENMCISIMSSVPARRIAMNFQGYRRPDGNAGTRNLVLIIPSVGCSQGAAQTIAQGLKGVVSLPNYLGCGQVGEDRGLVKKTLIGFGTHPNVSSVLIVGNGCEQLSPEEIAQGLFLLVRGWR